MCFFFFNDTATTEIYTLSLHDALPISTSRATRVTSDAKLLSWSTIVLMVFFSSRISPRTSTVILRDRSTCGARSRSEEHTSELQSRQYLVCRLLLEKKKN